MFRSPEASERSPKPGPFITSIHSGILPLPPSWLPCHVPGAGDKEEAICFIPEGPDTKPFCKRREENRPPANRNGVRQVGFKFYIISSFYLSSSISATEFCYFYNEKGKSKDLIKGCFCIELNFAVYAPRLVALGDSAQRFAGGLCSPLVSCPGPWNRHSAPRLPWLTLLLCELLRAAQAPPGASGGW